MAHPNSICGVVLAVGCTLLLGGCAGKKKDARPLREVVRDKVAEKLPQDPKLSILMDKNKFTVDDERGFRLLDADVGKVEGDVTPGKGVDGAVRMTTAKCRLYRAGKLEMTLDASEATWDGQRLVSEKPVHAVTAAQDQIIDAQSCVWHAKDGKLELNQARLQSMQKKKLRLTADAPTATVQDRIATMPKGAVGRTPEGDHMKGSVVRWHFEPRRLEASGGVTLVNSKGSQVTADRLKWTMPTGAVEAHGNVTLTEEGTRVSGQRLRANLDLKRGRLSGRTRVVMTRSPLKKNL